jgi:hypothetical protein
VRRRWRSGDWEGDFKYEFVCTCMRWAVGIATVPSVRLCAGVLRKRRLRVVLRCHSRPVCCSVQARVLQRNCEKLMHVFLMRS